jgi:hypothetical protein
MAVRQLVAGCSGKVSAQEGLVASDGGVREWRRIV